LLKGLLGIFSKKKASQSISSFNRNGNEPSSSQAPHHLMRGPLRETYNPKSASLSASSSSSTQQQQQQQQQISKIPEKIKCVFKIKTKKKSFFLSSIIIKYQT